MSGQLILTLGREFGSGGHEIARTLAGRFGLPLYEENILKKIAASRGLDVRSLERYDEFPKNHFLYRTVNGFSNAPGDVIAQMQFQYLRERAQAGESFVVVGRCAEEVLKGFPGLITIFVGADLDFKKERTMARGPVSAEEALALMAKKDKKRKTYHNQYCKGKWGDARNYDIAVNSARLGIEGTTDILEQYIRARIAKAEADASHIL